MIEIEKGLFIGNQDDYELTVKHKSEWVIIHACKEPYHRQLLGYIGKGAPKNHLDKKKLPINNMSAAEMEFIKLYPNYAPKRGIREFIKNNWGHYANGE